MIRREHAIQRQLVRCVPKVVTVPHIFACHDRGQARSEQEHIWEAERGIRKGWPDTELNWGGGRTFRCEMKRNGKQVELGSAQDRLRIALNQLDHPTSEADSVTGWCAEAERFGVPLRANWRTIAKLHDEYAAADIRDQEEKAAAKKAAALSTTDPPLIKPRPKQRRKVSPRTNVRIFAAMKPQPL